MLVVGSTLMGFGRVVAWHTPLLRNRLPAIETPAHVAPTDSDIPPG